VTANRKPVTRFFLMAVALFALAVARPAHARCASLVNRLEAENCLPGTPQNARDIRRAGDPTIQAAPTEISVDRSEALR